MGRIVVAVIVSMWVIPISVLVNRIVPDPYMDEIFHIPQAQRYCRGDFKTWDPMITTPPGLYCLSLAYVTSLFPGMWLAKAAESLSEVCSSAILRSVNGVLAVVCSIIVYDLLIHLQPTLGERKATAYAILLALYPVNWFFTFLYYTDVASLTAVLGMYLAILKRRYFVSAMLGALATLLRQTNVVWMMFVAANGAISYAEDFVRKNNKTVQKTDMLAKEENILSVHGLRRRRIGSSMNAVNLSTAEISKQSGSILSGLIDEMLDICSKLWCLKWKVLTTFSPFVLVLGAFVAFVLWNGSIVLGAKEAHVVSPHFAQMMYFALISSAALAPVHFSLGQPANMYRSFRKNKVLSSFQLLITLIVSFILVHFFSMAHPYLLADNRHYPFYIWRKLIQAHWMMKYLLVPLYVYSWFFIVAMLGKTYKKIWVLSFVLATALALVPAPLIEFRYYTIPFYFLILHSQIDGTLNWLLLGILYLSVNIFTMVMFLFRPFRWDHEPGIQRFIW